MSEREGERERKDKRVKVLKIDGGTFTVVEDVHVERSRGGGHTTRELHDGRERGRHTYRQIDIRIGRQMERERQREGGAKSEREHHHPNLNISDVCEMNDHGWLRDEDECFVRNIEQTVLCMLCALQTSGIIKVLLLPS